MGSKSFKLKGWALTLISALLALGGTGLVELPYLCVGGIIVSLCFWYSDAFFLKTEKLLYKKALAIREKVLGTKHPDTAISYNNIGVTLMENGQLEQAVPFCSKRYIFYHLFCLPITQPFKQY
jgi:hypothetical protein